MPKPTRAHRLFTDYVQQLRGQFTSRSEARERRLTWLDELERMRAEFEGAGLVRRRELLPVMEARLQGQQLSLYMHWMT